MAGARASFQVDDLYGARELTQQVLAQEPKRADALELLLQCCIASNDEAGALEARTKLLEVVPDADRFRLLVQIGEAYEAACDVEAADRSFRQALELEPNSRLVLNKLLNVYAESENWKRATETLGLLAAQETDTGRKARLLFSIGTMFRDQLEDTAFGTGSRTYTSGLGNHELTLTLYMSYAATETYATLKDLVGTTTTVIVKPTSAADSATNPGFTLTGAYLEELNVVNASLGELGTVECTWTGGVYSVDIS